MSEPTVGWMFVVAAGEQTLTWLWVPAPCHRYQQCLTCLSGKGNSFSTHQIEVFPLFSSTQMRRSISHPGTYSFDRWVQSSADGHIRTGFSELCFIVKACRVTSPVLLFVFTSSSFLFFCTNAGRTEIPSCSFFLESRSEECRSRLSTPLPQHLQPVFFQFSLHCFCCCLSGLDVLSKSEWRH